MTDHNDEPTDRETARLDWARSATGDPALDLQRASADAGFRSYWRGVPGHAGGSSPTGSAPTSVMVMDSPPELEDVRPWLRIRGLLEAHGVRVPRVLSQDTDNGFLLLEDLGTDTCLHVIDADNADTLFDAAIAELLKLQAIPCPAELPAYDEALLMRELRLFDEWFLGCHLGLTLGDTDRESLALVYRRLIDAALAQPQVLVHRDYMPRNLMPVPGARDGGLAVLDFQDAVRGPVAYDPISLFKDAFLSWPLARVDDWLRRYHLRASETGLPVPALPQFLRDADLIGVQRHLKVLGIFARLLHRDGKPRYVADAPRFIAYLEAVLPRYPELAVLADLLERRVKPALTPATHA